VVTHRSTNLPVPSLSTRERTGSSIFWRPMAVRGRCTRRSRISSYLFERAVSGKWFQTRAMRVGCEDMSVLSGNK
jgi:hypothetical protein